MSITPYRVVCADPPWRFGDSLPGKSRGASKNYRTMTLDEIKAYLPGLGLPIAPDAILFLWRVSAMVPEAYDVVKAWGFVAKSELVWEKRTSGGLPHFGMGRFTRAAHETCIIASRGQGSKLIKDHGVRSVFSAAVGRHSEKPGAFFDLVERLVSGPYVELFARERRCGWTAFGDELPGVAAE